MAVVVLIPPARAPAQGSLIPEPTIPPEQRHSFEKGDIFVAKDAEGINQIYPDGTFNRSLPRSGGPGQLAFDVVGDLYSNVLRVDPPFGSVEQYDRQGPVVGPIGHRPFGNVYAQSSDILFDKVGDAYVALSTAGRAGPDGKQEDIVKLDHEGNRLDHFDVAVDPTGTSVYLLMDLAADQCTLYYSSGGKQIKRFDVCAKTQLPDFVFVADYHPLGDLRIRSEGDVLFPAQKFGPNNFEKDMIVRLSATGSEIQTYDADAPGEPDYRNDFGWVSLDPDGRSFWTADRAPNGFYDVYKIDIETGALLFETSSSPRNSASGFTAALAVFGQLTAAAPTTIGASDAEVTEADSGTTTATFTVSLNAPAALPVLFTYATSDGSAKASGDYHATHGPLVIAPGQTTATVNVPVVGDTEVEVAEEFSLALSGVVNARMGRELGKGTIHDNDRPPAAAPQAGSGKTAPVTETTASGGGQELPAASTPGPSTTTQSVAQPQAPSQPQPLTQAQVQPQAQVQAQLEAQTAQQSLHQAQAQAPQAQSVAQAQVGLIKEHQRQVEVETERMAPDGRTTRVLMASAHTSPGPFPALAVSALVLTTMVGWGLLPPQESRRPVKAVHFLRTSSGTRPPRARERR